MKTKILDANDSSQIKVASSILRAGGTVAFPTETVYGLGANATRKDAVEKIFIAKGRPSDNPLIVHIGRKVELKYLVSEISDRAQMLIDEIWPGPLTLILKKQHTVPDVVTAGLDTVGVRMPSSPTAVALLKEARIPVAAPSANISGKPSPTKAQHVIEDLDGKVDAILVGEDSSVGIESTVLDMSGEKPVILRPGMITKHQIEDIIGTIVLFHDDCEPDLDGIPMAPGMKYKHYAPNAPVILVDGPAEQVAATIIKRYKKEWMIGNTVGIIATDETIEMYGACKNVKSMGSRKDLKTISRELFHVLRSFDHDQVDLILSETVVNDGVGAALMNRLLKAAGYQIIQGKS